MKREIKYLILDNDQWIVSENGEIKEIKIASDMGFVIWFSQKQGSEVKEYNPKYVKQVVYFEHE